MTALPAEKRYTYADLLSWEEDVRYELYDGYPIALDSPSRSHQRISLELGRQFGNHLIGKTCRVYNAPFDVRIFEEEGDSSRNVSTVLQPDLLVVCDPKKLDERGVRGAPDLVIEILSKTTRRLDLLSKYNIYQRAGVREYWIVDPDTQTVTVHTLEDGKYRSPAVVYRSDASVPVGVLEGFQVDLKTVFEE
ncbi:MAG: Uma2 family endonuclease [Oscillospiraceae bacterium]|jgi:Uma2 family endonuclease|nr:Uma2 family endonuclease [Oscillospiraceae bacterium]